jgi:SAM-dependent methyltransferase
VSELHPATRGFAAADVYERGRPGYPPAAVDAIVERLGLAPGRSVLDLAAGTGKLTRLLVPSGAEVVAVEPIAEMRAELARRLPGVRVLDGTAEQIPLPDGSLDGVTVASAFHWFDAGTALRELHRVLRPGGGVALVWNARDERQPLQAAFSAIVDPLRGDTPRRTQSDWRAVLAEGGLFERCERLAYANVHPVDEDGLVARALSISFIGAAPAAVRAEVEERMRALAHACELPLELAYTTELYVGFRVS